MAARRDAAQPEQMSLFDVIDAAFPSLGQVLLPAGAGAGRPAPARPAPPVVNVVHAHPQADREILFGDCRVAYQLRRARRKSIGFVVSPDGLSVSAPRWVGQGDIDQALRAKSGWILRKLGEQRDRRRHLEASRIEWREGASLPFLGEPLVLRLDARVVGAQLTTDGPRELRIGLAPGAAVSQIRDTVQSWLQQEALPFRGRCAHFAERLGVTLRRLRLSAAQTRWGSASADGSVRLNWRLIHFSPAVIDYVVAHELAHLREMNHSPAFWEVVRSVIPDLDARRAALKSPVLPLFD
jgi:predicted metal-dependent hydrolase